MTREDFIKWALERGWRKDRYGHLQKQANGKNYRFKLSRVAVRYESQITLKGFSRGKHRWVRIRSGYLSKLHLTPEGKLAGLR